MTPTNPLWIVPTIQRYKLPIIALACLAAGATIYYAQYVQSSAESIPNPRVSLRRSNASRRRRRRRSAGVLPESEEQDLLGQALVTERRANPQALIGGETETDAVSEYSWDWEDEGKEEEESKDGQSLLLLLYKIAEENSRKDGYVHRGVTCDSCNENPIKGIRYRCANCADYDLCETCESTHTHNREHLFWKIRIPAPRVGTHKEREPVFYPGKPKAIIQDLRKEKVDKFCKDTGYKIEEIEAFWEQFRSMAATEWPNDPDNYGLAIDRPTFDKCFIPSTSQCPPPPNLIYNRIFSYYDTNDDGLIGFDEFIKGLASLKKKNAAERMKRVFRGYDINDDGYVDRRDFLRIFRAYYALTKEQMLDIVTAMQDEDDQDARDLVGGGQPISSAFNGPGPMHSGDLRHGRVGKVQNNFGDYDIIDGMGAVDEYEFSPNVELDNIISENAEAARWPTKRFPMSRPDFPRSGRSIHEYVTHISREDLQILLEYYDVYGILDGPSTEEEAEKLLRRRLHGKLATELRRRRSDRRDAVIQRARRQSFYQYHDNPCSSLNPPLEVGGMLADPRLHTQMYKDLRDIESSQLANEFREQFYRMIESLDWPIENAVSFENTMFEMVRKGWSRTEFVRDLDGYSPDPKNVEAFVLGFVKLLSRIATEARMQPGYKTSLKKVSVRGRSRSSSKVRFEDSLGDVDDEDELNSAASFPFKNRPSNERLSGFEAPEPETDVGRELLFTITEEALNELLDPVFKLREDLALRALLKKKRRRKHRANIIAAVPSYQNLRDVKLYLERYSRRWRQKKDRPPPPEHEQDDEAVYFAKFVDTMESGRVSLVNGTRCTECFKHDQISWVRIGEYCSRTQYHSKRPTGQAEGRRLADEKTSPAEKCPMCDQMGNESWISALYCDRCGQPCSRLIVEEAKIRSIIEHGGGEATADPDEEVQTRNSSLERSPSPSPPSAKTPEDGAFASSLAQAETSSTKLDPENPRTASTPQDGPLSRNFPSEPSSTRNNITSQDPTPNTKPSESETVEYTDNETYLSMANDLHDSITTFNALDPTSVETLIASKPLGDLLAESGYASAEHQPPSSSSTMRPPVDPTLPQNRPNAITPHSASPSHSSNSTPQRPSFKANEKRPEDPLPSATPTEGCLLREEDADRGVPSKSLCKFYACLDILEAEDQERGGPGRINFEEFEEIMMGEKGAGLGFLAGWIDLGAF